MRERILGMRRTANIDSDEAVNTHRHTHTHTHTDTHKILFISRAARKVIFIYTSLPY